MAGRLGRVYHERNTFQARAEGMGGSWIGHTCTPESQARSDRHAQAEIVCEAETENERKTSDRYRPCVFSRRLFGSPVSLYGSSFRSQRSLDIPPEPRSTQRQKHPGICSCHISFIKQISPPMGRLNAIISERNGGNKVHGTEVEAYPTYTLCHRAKRIV